MVSRASNLYVSYKAIAKREVRFQAFLTNSAVKKQAILQSRSNIIADPFWLIILVG